ncbi:VOC family protein [Edaphobacter sp. HDX4]
MHYGLITANIDVMTEWYRNVLGMRVNHRSKIPAIARLTRNGPPFLAFAFVSNDERDHRIVFFEIPRASVDPEKRQHTGLQHVAFEYASLDDLLGTYLRLKKRGIRPTWAADHGVGSRSIMRTRIRMSSS